MSDQLAFHPSSLMRSQLDRLSTCAREAERTSPNELLDAAKEHLELARQAYKVNRLINLRMASAIFSVLEGLVNSWGALEPNHAWWVRGAIYYFATSNDDEPDFHSPLGFEDDLEILNACLKFINRCELCLNAEDYDNV